MRPRLPYVSAWRVHPPIRASTGGLSNLKTYGIYPGRRGERAPSNTGTCIEQFQACGVRRAAAPKGWDLKSMMDSLRQFQAELLSRGLASADAPPVHREAACQGDNGLLAFADTVRITQSWPPFFNQPVVGLVFDQSPGRFAECPAQSWIAALGQRALPSVFPAAVFAGHQTGVRGHLPPIAEAMPVAHLAFQRDHGQAAQPAWNGQGHALFEFLGQGLNLEV
jgi:hypothetical protein